jgi:hypothetical protein
MDGNLFAVLWTAFLIGILWLVVLLVIGWRTIAANWRDHNSGGL